MSSITAVVIECAGMEMVLHAIYIWAGSMPPVGQMRQTNLKVISNCLVYPSTPFVMICRTVTTFTAVAMKIN